MKLKIPWLCLEKHNGHLFEIQPTNLLFILWHTDWINALLYTSLCIVCWSSYTRWLCPTCCWDLELNRVVTEWFDGGAVAYARHKIASANLVNNAKIMNKHRSVQCNTVKETWLFPSLPPSSLPFLPSQSKKDPANQPFSFLPHKIKHSH